MAFAGWAKVIGDRLPVIGRLRRQRDHARRECARLVGMLSEAHRRDGAMLVQRGQLTLLLDPTSLVDSEVYGRGSWEAGTIAAMADAARALKDDPRRKIFLDIGAHWGLYGLSMRRLGIFDAIHCFEPEPHNFAQLGAQLFLNHASYDIAAHAVAAFDRAGTMRIQRATGIADGNRGSAALVDASADGVTVPAVAIDDVIPVNDAIVFIKIDAEGSEGPILDGMQRLLAANEIYLQVEVLAGAEGGLAGRVPERLKLRQVREVDHIFSSFELPGAGSPP